MRSYKLIYYFNFGPKFSTTADVLCWLFRKSNLKRLRTLVRGSLVATASGSGTTHLPILGSGTTHFPIFGSGVTHLPILGPGTIHLSILGSDELVEGVETIGTMLLELVSLFENRFLTLSSTIIFCSSCVRQQHDARKKGHMNH